PFLCLPGFGQKVLSIKVDGTINPASADYIANAIKQAGKENAEALLIRLNTPGGLLKSTRKIVSDILESPVPVIVYVSPGGAHAGSAGAFITMSAHVAAIAPSTNIGAAHPVGGQSGSDPIMRERVANDGAACVRAIAAKRNRNTEWAEKAVIHSLSITETEALEYKVIDLVAPNERALLQEVNGRIVEVGSTQRAMQTGTATVEEVEMNFIEKFLDLISNPDIAYILMMLGFYGLLFEIYSPGAIFPGVIGGICIILAFYSMHTLPLNYAGLALIILSIIMFTTDIKINSHGILGIGGTVALALGSMMLIRVEDGLEFLRISRSVILGTVAITAAFFFFLIAAVARAHKAPP